MSLHINIGGFRKDTRTKEHETPRAESENASVIEGERQNVERLRDARGWTSTEERRTDSIFAGVGDRDKKINQEKREYSLSVFGGWDSKDLQKRSIHISTA